MRLVEPTTVTSARRSPGAWGLTDSVVMAVPWSVARLPTAEMDAEAANVAANDDETPAGHWLDVG